MCSIFFFNDTATTEIYTLSLHDALPIWGCASWKSLSRPFASSTTVRELRLPLHVLKPVRLATDGEPLPRTCRASRSEEHTSELQSRQYLVCRLLLEKKKKLACPHTITRV